MAPDVFTISLTCERSLAKTVIRVVLQVIFFQRAFGTIAPRTNDVLGLTFPSIASSPELDAQIDGKVDEIYRAMEHQSSSGAGNGRARKAEALVSFCEKRVKKNIWYGRTEEEVPWEEYRINIEMLSGQTERERNKIDSTTKAQLSEFLMDLVVFAERHKAQAPPITNNDIVPFPWRITVNQGSA